MCVSVVSCGYCSTTHKAKKNLIWVFYSYFWLSLETLCFLITKIKLWFLSVDQRFKTLASANATLNNVECSDPQLLCSFQKPFATIAFILRQMFEKQIPLPGRYQLKLGCLSRIYLSTNPQDFLACSELCKVVKDASFYLQKNRGKKGKKTVTNTVQGLQSKRAMLFLRSEAGKYFSPLTSVKEPFENALILHRCHRQQNHLAASGSCG